jgi:hypothetical protein
MLLTITTTHRPATDLGFRLHKESRAVWSFVVGFLLYGDLLQLITAEDAEDAEDAGSSRGFEAIELYIKRLKKKAQT